MDFFPYIGPAFWQNPKPKRKKKRAAMNLDKVLVETERVFNGSMKVPELAIYDERLSICVNKPADLALFTFDKRRMQASAMGFQACSLEKLIEAMMGKPATSFHEAPLGKEFEWFLNHHSNKDEAKDWLFKPCTWVREERRPFLNWKPLESVVIWEVQKIILSDYKQEVPLGAILRLLQAKATGLFNYFVMIRPAEGSAGPVNVPPVILGVIAEILPNRRSLADHGLTNYYVLCSLKGGQ